LASVTAHAGPAAALSGSLLPGFVILVVGLAGLSFRRTRPPIQSPHATIRALLYALVFGLATAAFTRGIGAAVMGDQRSPSLLALWDVIFVTLGLFVWVMALVEGYSPRDFGFRSLPSGRFVLATLMGLGMAAVYAFDAWTRLASGRIPVGQDELVYALLAATLGSAIPEETLFRGYLMGSLEGRTRTWERIAIGAIAYSFARSLRTAPLLGLGSPAWLSYFFGVDLPMGLGFGIMRELARGAIWPCIVSHFALELGLALSGSSPTLP
jgi:membrane protease YdiL (CAAX protease family)